MEKLVQLPPRSQGDHECPAPGHLQLQVLVLHLPGEIQNYFCFLVVDYLQEENDLQEKACADTLGAPFTEEDGID